MLTVYPCTSSGKKSRKYRRNPMRKVYLVTAILLLSSAWVLAQSSTPPVVPDNSQSVNPQNPSNTSSASQQPAIPDKSETGTQASSSGQTAQTVEGCLGGATGGFTLIDSSGKTYQLAGDTSKLSEHVGHMVRITGSEEGGATANAGAQPTLTVKNVKMVSSSCPSNK
jgi:cytoskeletal protein RodZ